MQRRSAVRERTLPSHLLRVGGLKVAGSKHELMQVSCADFDMNKNLGSEVGYIGIEVSSYSEAC